VSSSRIMPNYGPPRQPPQQVNHDRERALAEQMHRYMMRDVTAPGKNPINDDSDGELDSDYEP